MSWIKNIFTSVDKAIEKIPSEQEREKIRGELTKELMIIEAELEAKVMEQATLRYQRDMESDSWLNKHIRAIIMLIYTALIVILPFVESTPQSVMDLYSTIAMLVYGFYFGGKSFEKSIELINLVKRGK